MTSSRSNPEPPFGAAEAVAAVRILWLGPRPPSLEEVLTPAMMAGEREDGGVLAEVIAEDIAQRSRRGLGCGLGVYGPCWETLRRSGPARRAVLVGEFIDCCGGGGARDGERGETVAEVRARLGELHPELKEDIDAIATLAMVVCGEELLDASRFGPGSRVGKYVLGTLLGAGTFADTWLAWDGALRRHVALKLLRGRRGDGEDGQERVLAEAAAAAGLEHPAIVRVHEAGQIDGVGYIDTQFVGSVEGVGADGLAERVTSLTAESFVRGGPLGAERAARLVGVVAGAVAAAHARGITHRDIKPANILIAPSGEPMLADFGLASVEGAQGVGRAEGDDGRGAARERRRIVGTPAYLAPEVAGGGAATPLSDVFSLGCTLRALLTGMTPRGGETGGAPMGEVLAGIAGRPLGPVAGVGVGRAVPRTLARIVDRATAHEPSERYTSADGLAADLRAYLEHRPVEADPGGTLGLVRLWATRHRTGVIVAGVLAVAVGGLAAVFVGRLAAERNLAVAAERLAEARRAEAEAANATVMQMNRFVSRMFNSTRGQQSGSAEFTVIDAIRLGTARVDRTFADRPVAAAAVQHFLGQAASSSADFETARKNLDAALQTRTRLLGPTHPDTISTLRARGEMLSASGRKEEAGAVFAGVVAALGEEAALRNADGLYALGRVGGAAMNRREFAEARRVLGRVAAAYAERPSDGSADHQAALNMLVTLHLSEREFALAEATQRRIVELNTGLLGGDDISTINSLTTVGFVLRESGEAAKRDEARAVYADAIAQYVRAVGESNRYTLNTRLELALTCIPDDPEAALEQLNIVEPHAMLLAPNQLNRLKFGWVRGQALVAAGRPEEAAVGLQQAFDSALAAMGPANRWTRRTAALLSGTLEKLGRRGEAAAVRAKVAPPTATPSTPAHTPPPPPGDPSDAD